MVALGQGPFERITTADFGVVETTYEYNARFNKLTFKRDPEGRETRHEIDPDKGNLLQTTDAVGNVIRYRYDDHGQLVEKIDPRGHATTYSDFDSFGKSRTERDPLGNVTTREYDARGRLTRASDTWGRETRAVFDGLDRPVEVVRAAGGASENEVTRTEYFPHGEEKSVTNAKGGKTTFTLDGLNRVVATATELGSEDVLTTATEYDGNGNKVKETDRRGVVRRHTYDALDRPVKTEILSGLTGEGPLGQIATCGYDLADNRLFDTDVARLRTDYEHDGLYRVRKKLLPESGSSGRYFEEYAHDRVGSRTLVKDANGNPTRFEGLFV